MPINGVIARFATGTYVVTRTAEGTYADGELVPATASTANIEISATDEVDDTLTSVAHGAASGDGPVRVIGADIPDGITDDIEYWLIVIDADTLQLALTEADALAGTPVFIDIVGDGAVLSETLLSFESFQTLMCIQPATGKDLDAVPEADRTSDMKLVLVESALRTRMPGQEPDSVLYKGEDWTVVHSEEWEHWGSTHFRCFIARDEVT